MMKTLSKEQVFQLFESSEKKHYKKSGKFIFRRSESGESVMTIVSGKLEALKRAKVGDYILRNIEVSSSAETYIIDVDMFESRYDITQEQHLIDGHIWTICLAKGECEAFCFDGDEPIKFMAPWDEEMLCEKGDFIARPIPGAEHDIYRIERQTFLDTYEEKVSE